MPVTYGPPSDPEKSPDWCYLLAREHPGVRYDPRSRKYTASIMIDRKRVFLGSFETPQAAGAAYAEKRKAHPKRSVETKAFGTMKTCWADFLDQAERNEKGYVAEGNVFVTPDGQAYLLKDVEIRRGKFGMWVWFKWEGRCSICGEEFETTTKGRAKTLRGMIRTCPAHRGQHHRKRPGEELI